MRIFSTPEIWPALRFARRGSPDPARRAAWRPRKLPGMPSSTRGKAASPESARRIIPAGPAGRRAAERPVRSPPLASCSTGGGCQRQHNGRVRATAKAELLVSRIATAPRIEGARTRPCTANLDRGSASGAVAPALCAHGGRCILDDAVAPCRRATSPTQRVRRRRIAPNTNPAPASAASDRVEGSGTPLNVTLSREIRAWRLAAWSVGSFST